MTLQDKIEAALQAEFSPSQLEVVNESRMHAGHNPEAAATGQTHFRIRITAETLTGMSRVDQHRAINAALAFGFDEGLHALAIEVGKG
ncbi:BolA family protein [Rhizobium sp. G21]|uniref:BolA family protein n=1 Tax=Rhizobium sp. G21 TaxID=2758439 RepID=UPI001600759D|nr:BolA family protein [Rhizobium sp. G21]MBB1249171.1 BolA family transcriptional regulator [Rhizobium sp. G21]